MDKLEDKYIKFIDTYLNSKNLTETCKKIDITRSTAYRYLKEDIVKAEIDKRRSELISDTTLYLQDSLQECSKVLMDIVKDPKASPQVKINAINSIFSNCNKLTETNNILTKLVDIEERLAERENEEKVQEL